MKFWIVILIFLLFSSLLVISNYNIYIFNEGGLKNFGTLYMGWLGEFYSGAKIMTMNAVKFDFSESKNKSEE